MAIAGAAFGAGKVLEQILGEQMMQAQMQAREREAQARTQLDREQLNEQILQNDIGNKRQAKLDDERSAEKRNVANRQGVRRMIGDSLMQRTGPLGPEDRRSIAAMQVEAGDLPDMSLLSEPKKERDPIADHEAKAQIDARYRQKPTGPAAPRTPQWVRMGDGSVVDINGVAPKGSKPYDAVAERSSQPVNQAEAADTAREVVRIAGALKGHKGLGGAFGVADSMLPTLRQDTADAESLRDALTSLLTLENMGKMKGVLSDSDMKVLRQASSTINPRMGDAAARAELQRIIDVMGRASGDAGMPSMDMATSRGGGSPAPAAKRMRFDAKGNQIP